MNKDEALKLALEALEFNQANWQGKDKAITSIKEALAQPEHLVTKPLSLPEQEWTPKDMAYRPGGLAQPKPLEYWNAVEGWVKIDEVRKHFDSVGCGTIYKTAGEGRAPLYTSPPKREWIRLTPADFEKLEQLYGHQVSNDFAFADIVCQVEALLKEKNNG